MTFWEWLDDVAMKMLLLVAVGGMLLALGVMALLLGTIVGCLI